MKKIYLAIIPILLGYGIVKSQNVASGEKSFKATCSACHTIGKGKVVGPDLAGISQKRNEKWLVSWIKSSQTLVKNNDPLAVKIFNENNKIVMPDANLSDMQIKDILAYIKSVSPATTPPKTTTKPTTPTTTGTKKPAVTTAVSTENDKNWVNSDYQIKCVKSTDEINPKSLNVEFWKKIPATLIPLSAQNVTYPHLQKVSLDSISVKSAYFKNEIIFLMEWKDSSKSSEVDADKFCDQLALEFPLTSSDIPSYMMGNKGGMVHIVHWKAIWQEDCEKGFQDVQMKYPNMWVDVYPGLEGYLDRSKRIYSKDITAEQIVETHSYGNMPGTYSGNPMSRVKRKEPVEEASAEGFGTLSSQETQQAKGWAEWKNGKWMVCIIVPVNTGNVRKAIVKEKTKVAFALWDGGYQNIGGRKHFIPWVDLLLEK